MADMLAVSVEQLRRWAKQSLVPKLTLPSGRYVFNPDEVIAALAAGGTPAEAHAAQPAEGVSSG